MDAEGKIISISVIFTIRCSMYFLLLQCISSFTIQVEQSKIISAVSEKKFKKIGEGSFQILSKYLDSC